MIRVGGIGGGIGVVIAVAVAGCRLPMYAKTFAGKDVRYWGESVVGLRSGNVVDMRGTGKIGRLVGDVSSHRVRLMSAGETLVEWCGLDDSLVRKLLVRGWNDGKTWRRPLLGCLRSL